ncbi:HPr family phosphocarrier protein [Streptomyces koyangensis]
MTIASNGKSADAKSLFKLQTLGLTQGTVLTIGAEGEDEHRAVEHLVKLMAELEQNSSDIPGGRSLPPRRQPSAPAEAEPMTLVMPSAAWRSRRRVGSATGCQWTRAEPPSSFALLGVWQPGQRLEIAACVLIPRKKMAIGPARATSTSPERVNRARWIPGVESSGAHPSAGCHAVPAVEVGCAEARDPRAGEVSGDGGCVALVAKCAGTRLIRWSKAGVVWSGC